MSKRPRLSREQEASISRRIEAIQAMASNQARARISILEFAVDTNNPFFTPTEVPDESARSNIESVLNSAAEIAVDTGREVVQSLIRARTNLPRVGPPFFLEIARTVASHIDMPIDTSSIANQLSARINFDTGVNNVVDKAVRRAHAAALKKIGAPAMKVTNAAKTSHDMALEEYPQLIGVTCIIGRMTEMGLRDMGAKFGQSPAAIEAQISIVRLSFGGKITSQSAERSMIQMLMPRLPGVFMN